MSTNFTGVTFAKQKVTPSDDAIIRRAILPDGILYGCELTYSGSTLTMSAGQLLICGRQIRHPASQNWAVVDATSGYARLLLTVDLTKTSTKETFDQVVDSIEYASSEEGFPDLEQTDINVAGSRYQVVACVVSLGTGGITGIVSQIGTTSVSEILANFNGGMKMDLLWENASPTSNFAAQTISLDLADYDMVFVEFAYSATGAQRFTGFARKNQTTYIGVSGTLSTFRAVTVHDNGCAFQAGYLVSAYGTATANDARAIPTAIYGVRGVAE